MKVYFQSYGGADYSFDPITRKIGGNSPAPDLGPWKGGPIFEKMDTPARIVLESHLASKRRMLQLNITEDCSNRCGYCVFSGSYIYERKHSKKYMSLDTARLAIDDFLAHATNKEMPHISFYGGEPLLSKALGLIRKMVHIAKEKSNRKLSFGLTTNGRHLDHDTITFLAENDFLVMVSLDGPKDIHDRYRRTQDGRPTFDEVMNNLRRLRESAPDYYQKNVGFICVLTPPLEYHSIKDFFNGEELLKNHNLIVSFINAFDNILSFSDLLPDFDLNRVQMYREAIRAYYESALNGSLQEHGFEKALLSKGLGQLHRAQQELGSAIIGPNGCCSPGARRCFADTDGTLYACEKVAGFKPIGNVKNGISVDLAASLLQDYKSLCSPDCLECWCGNICDLCYFSARKGTDFDAERKRLACDEKRDFSKALLRLYASLRDELQGDQLDSIMPSLWG